MIKILQNIVSDQEIKKLLDYNSLYDHRTQIRSDFRSKNPRWDIDIWPQDTVKNILDRILDRSWNSDKDTIYFIDNYVPGQGFRLHVDSADGSNNLYYNIVIPLYKEGDTISILFDNYWNDSSTRFSRKPIDTFSYPLMGNNGIVEVEDIRELLKQCKHSPETVKDFTVDKNFISILENLVQSHTGQRPSMDMEESITLDYNKIVNYNPVLKFDKEIHEKYLKHIPIENLHGLTIDKIVPWEIGSVFVFPRTQLHCFSWPHTRKIGLHLFTNSVNPRWGLPPSMLSVRFMHRSSIG